MFTNTKAPMAHKNFSKEQFKFQYYLFKISIQGELNLSCKYDLNLNKLLYLIILLKHNFFNFETNLFFLKNYFLVLSCTEKTFFNYYAFVNQN